jgi:hypothetical protein
MGPWWLAIAISSTADAAPLVLQHQGRLVDASAPLSYSMWLYYR